MNKIRFNGNADDADKTDISGFLSANICPIRVIRVPIELGTGAPYFIEEKPDRIHDHYLSVPLHPPAGQALQFTPIIHKPKFSFNKRCHSFVLYLMHTCFVFFITLVTLSFNRCGNSGPVGTAANDTTYTYKTPHPDGTGKVYLGREIAHVMTASGADWLERSTRQQEEDAQAAIAALPLKPGSTVADIGAGTGYYTFRLARRVPQGRVYAVEVQDEFVASLQARTRRESTTNVTVVKGTERSPNLPDTSVDLALMVDVYHELAYPREMLQALHKTLRRDGYLLLLEYRAEDPSIPIKALHKLSVAQAKKELLANGFVLAEKKDFLPIQHYLLFRKKD